MTIEQLLNKYKKAYPSADVFISEGGISVKKGERVTLIHGCRAAATLYLASLENKTDEVIDIPLEETPSIEPETPVVTTKPKSKAKTEKVG